MKREPIVFIIILVILGMKVSTLLSEKVPSGRIRAGVKSLEFTRRVQSTWWQTSAMILFVATCFCVQAQISRLPL